MDKSLNHMARPPLLTRTIEDSIVLTLFDIANELGKLGEGVSSKAGLTTQQWLMLLQIAGDPNFAVPKDGPSRNGPGIMASEIARARGVSRANVSMLVAQLLRMGLVNQAEQPDDRNAFRAQLISDCQILIVVSIGGPAAAKVIKAGIYPMKQPEEADAETLITRFQAMLNGKPPPWLAKVMGLSPRERVRFDSDDPLED